MKAFDIMPIIIVIAALLANIAIGINNNIDFSVLMIRCIGVTIVFGVFGYMVTETVRNAIECSKLSGPSHEKSGKDDGLAGVEKSNDESMPVLDIKVPPLDDDEFIYMDNDSDNEFVEVNPVFMGKYKNSEQD